MVVGMDFGMKFGLQSLGSVRLQYVVLQCANGCLPTSSIHLFTCNILMRQHSWRTLGTFCAGLRGGPLCRPCGARSADGLLRSSAFVVDHLVALNHPPVPVVLTALRSKSNALSALMQTPEHDSRALIICLANSILWIPGQLMMLRASPDVNLVEVAASMAARTSLGLASMAVLYLISVRRRWYLRHRTFVLIIFFLVSWLSLFISNTQVLFFGIRADVPLFGAATVAGSVSLALTMHVIIPLRSAESFGLDLWAVTVAIMVHALAAVQLLGPDDAFALNGSLLTMGAVMPVLLFPWSQRKPASLEESSDEADELLGAKSQAADPVHAPTRSSFFRAKFSTPETPRRASHLITELRTIRTQCAQQEATIEKSVASLVTGFAAQTRHRRLSLLSSPFACFACLLSCLSIICALAHLCPVSASLRCW